MLRARDERLDRPVAIKELLVWDPQQERRFVREALLTARLQHPAIVPIYEAGRWPDGEPFYAMKLVSGRSLAELIGERDTFTARLGLLPHVLTAAQAVAYAHSQQIIHRDLKPANVLVGEFGETVVIDWGLAKKIGEEEAEAEPVTRGGEGLTQVGAVMGTPWYMPPEQAAGAAVDERADVYALGAMLYQVLAAVPPYHEAPWERLLAAIAAGPPRPIEALAPTLADELAAIVHKAMARDPADRYRHAGALADDLSRFQTGQIVAAHSYSAGQLLRRYWRRHRAALSVATAAIVVLALVVLAAFVETDRERRNAEAKEREAVAARGLAEAAGTEATARADEMTLLQAQDALRRDPNQALAWLKTLSRGFAGATRVRRIAAEAQARGISRAFHGHSEYINRFDVAADGRRFVTASDDKTVRVWDLASGASRVLVGHTDEVWHARFTGGGAGVATISKDRTLRLWDASSGAARGSHGLPGRTRQLVVRADGALLGGQTDGGAAWILRPGAAAVEQLTDPAERPRWAYLSLDGWRMIVATEDDDVYVVDVAGGPRRRLPGTRGAPGKWFLDEHGERVVQIGPESTALWDLASVTGRELGVVTQSRRPTFSPQGDRVAFGVGPDVHVYDTRSGALVRRLVGHEGPVQMSGFSADGRRLASGSVDRTVRTWDLASGQSEVHAGFEGLVTELELLADGRVVLATSSAGEVRRFESRRAGQVVTDHGAPATGLALSVDARVATIDERGSLRIAELEGRSIAELRTRATGAVQLVAAPDGRSFAGVARAWVIDSDGRHPDREATPGTLLLGGFTEAAPRELGLPAAALELAWLTDGSGVVVALVDGTVRRVDRAGGMTEIDRFTAPATSVAATDGWVAAGSEDGRVRVTGLAAGGGSRELPRHKERVTGLAFAPGGAWLASGCADHTVRLWRLADDSFRSFDEGGHGMEQVGFSADGATLILLSGGETQLRRIAVASGEHGTPLAGALGRLVGFTVVADGRRLLTFGADGAARLIDLVDGEGRTLAGHSMPVVGAGFAAGGRVIVTLGQEGTARAWPDDLPETMAELRAWIEAATPERVAGR